MTKKFENRVLEQGLVDTKRFRYVCREFPDRLEIQRIPVELLGTVAAWDEWETVKVIENCRKDSA